MPWETVINFNLVTQYMQSKIEVKENTCMMIQTNLKTSI